MYIPRRKLDGRARRRVARTEVTLEEVTVVPETRQEAGTIVEVAAANGSFETLVKAVRAAGLAETLSGEGPFTVFAPTDEAFSKLPDGTLEELLADRERLAEILTYHVVPGRVTASEVQGIDSAETVAGGSLPIRTEYGSVKVGDATLLYVGVPDDSRERPDGLEYPVRGAEGGPVVTVSRRP